MGDAAASSNQELDRLTLSVERYLREHKGWEPDQFRVDVKVLEPETGQAVVWAICLEDEDEPAPGGGQSVELHVDMRTGTVTQELHFQ